MSNVQGSFWPRFNTLNNFLSTGKLEYHDFGELTRRYHHSWIIDSGECHNDGDFCNSASPVSNGV